MNLLVFALLWGLLAQDFKEEEMLCTEHSW